MTEDNRSALAEMDALLKQSEKTVRLLGELVVNAHQSGGAMTDAFWQERARMREEIEDLTRAWKERYNSHYQASI